MENTTIDNGTIEVLNDLVEINNDRIAGYEKAANEIENDVSGLKELYLKMAGQSRDMISQLRHEIASMGGEVEEGTTVSGKIYRAWMDVKSAFSSQKGQSTLELCEYGEDAAQKAYEEALATDEFLDTQTRQLITDQKADLKISHDIIKRHRDASRNN